VPLSASFRPRPRVAGTSATTFTAFKRRLAPMVEPWPRGQGQALTALSSMRGAGSRYSPGEPPCHSGPHVLQDGPPNRDGRTSLLHCDPFDAVSNLMSSSLALCPSMRVTSALDKVRRA